MKHLLAALLAALVLVAPAAAGGDGNGTKRDVCHNIAGVQRDRDLAELGLERVILEDSAGTVYVSTYCVEIGTW